MTYLVLASCDPDITFAVIAALTADKDEDLRRALQASDERLRRAWTAIIGKS